MYKVTTVRFYDRQARPSAIDVGMTTDNMVERVVFALPEIASGQSCTLKYALGSAADLILLTYSADAGGWYFDVDSTITRSAGGLDAYITIQTGGEEVWNSKPFALIVRELPDVDGAVTRAYPTAVQEMMDAIVAFYANIEGGGADGREVCLRAGDTHLQWKYETDAQWTNLVALTEIGCAANASVVIKGLYGTLEALRAAHATASAGDAYAVGTREANTVYIWNAGTSAWTDIGPFKGDKGSTGARGATGLTGATGAPGANGADGADGALWHAGTGVTGTSATATAFPQSGVAGAKAGDLYLNTATGNVYRCALGGGASTATWAYQCCLKPSVVVDSALSSTSANPLSNAAIYAALAGKAGSTHTHAASQVTAGTLPGAVVACDDGLAGARVRNVVYAASAPTVVNGQIWLKPVS